MTPVNILSEEFAESAALAGFRARQEALDAGHSVVFLDDLGRYVEEWPDGRRFEIRLQAGASRDSRRHVIGELPPAVR